MQASWWVFPLHWVLWAECSLTESSSSPLCLPLSGVRRVSLGLASPHCPSLYVLTWASRLWGPECFLFPINGSSGGPNVLHSKKCIIVVNTSCSVASWVPCVQVRSRPESWQQLDHDSLLRTSTEPEEATKTPAPGLVTDSYLTWQAPTLPSKKARRANEHWRNFLDCPRFLPFCWCD